MPTSLWTVMGITVSDPGVLGGYVPPGDSLSKVRATVN